jgi:hypothetical protein
MLRTVLSLIILSGSFALAQTYQCTWSVVDQGGGLMSSTNYRVLPSVGQTATGIITSSNFQSFIGFWQMDTSASGIREDSHWSQATPLVTMLCTPAPNPSPLSRNAQVRYSLAVESPVSIQLFDLTGRNIAALVNGIQPAGRYSYSLLTTHYSLARGVYFLKMSAGDYHGTRKLVIE